MSQPTLTNQLACAERQTEKLRARYAKKLADGGRFNTHAWDNEINNMEAICETLQKMVYLEEVSKEMILRPTPDRVLVEVEVAA